MDGLDEVVPARLRDLDPQVNRTTGAVVESAVAVQRALGTGLLEKAYEWALAHELRLRGCHVETQVPLGVRYKDLHIAAAYRLDLVVDGRVVVELKTAEDIDRRHLAQVATYLRFSGHSAGLLINFHVIPLKMGIHRVVLSR